VDSKWPGFIGFHHIMCSDHYWNLFSLCWTCHVLLVIW